MMRLGRSGTYKLLTHKHPSSLSIEGLAHVINLSEHDVYSSKSRIGKLLSWINSHQYKCAQLKGIYMVYPQFEKAYEKTLLKLFY